MPYYHFRHLETNEETEVFMKISELDDYRKDHPELDLMPACPALGDSLKLGFKKHKLDSRWHDKLNAIEKNHLGSKIFRP